MDASVEVRLEIQTDIPSGAPEEVVRTVTENARTLKFDQHGFEQQRCGAERKQDRQHGGFPGASARVVLVTARHLREAAQETLTAAHECQATAQAS